MPTINTKQIVILGAPGAGKSTLCAQLVRGNFVCSYEPTLEDIYSKRLCIDGNMVNIEVLDSSGAEGFMPLRELYISNGEGFILAFDLTQANSLLYVMNIREQILRKRERYFHIGNGGLQPNSKFDLPEIVLVGCKADLAAEREISRDQAITLAQDWKVPYMETSAKSNSNVQEVFEAITRNILYQQHPVSMAQNSPKLVRRKSSAAGLVRSASVNMKDSAKCVIM
jgi:GTPase SAR1 family protein